MQKKKLVLHCVKLPLVSGVVFLCISSVQCIPISQLFYKCNYILFSIYIKQLNQKGRNHDWFHCFPKPLSLQNLAAPYPTSTTYKVEKILKGSLDSIPSSLPSVKIQIMAGKVFLRCKGKTLLGIVNKLLKTKKLLASPSTVLLFT